MTYYNTHKISTNYHGSVYNVHYWPEGDGAEAEGYVTDFEQYCDSVVDHLENSNIAFMIITTDGKPKHITNTEELRAAVQHLDDDTVLSVQALDESSKSGRSKRKNKRTEYEESDDEGDDWNAEAVNDLTTDSHDKKIHSIIDHFVTHVGECHHCSMTEWTGRRYNYVYSSLYSMCGSCYDELSEDYKEDWKDAGLPWEGDAPTAPLGDDYGESEEVKHLQYLLTRLGHMKMKDTASLIGSYQEKTENGVASFRKEHNINGGDPTMYDKKTAVKLAKVVKKMRSNGHRYL